MPSYVSAEWARLAADAGLANLEMRCLLITGDSSTPLDPAQGHQFVGDIVADEASGTNYARVPVTGVQAGVVAAGEFPFLADDAVYEQLGANTGPVRAVVYYLHVTDDDDSPILVHDITAIDEEARTPDGDDFIIRPGTGGFGKGVTEQASV